MNGTMSGSEYAFAIIYGASMGGINGLLPGAGGIISGIIGNIGDDMIIERTMQDRMGNNNKSTACDKTNTKNDKNSWGKSISKSIGLGATGELGQMIKISHQNTTKGLTVASKAHTFRNITNVISGLIGSFVKF